jgi:hypothetical protein
MCLTTDKKLLTSNACYVTWIWALFAKGGIEPGIFLHFLNAKFIIDVIDVTVSLCWIKKNV